MNTQMKLRTKDYVNLSEEQINTYRTLSGQCPLLNADVVYRSRAVMRLYDDTTFYDDASICDNIGMTYKLAKSNRNYPSANKTSISCTLSPNPTDKYSLLRFSEIPSEAVSVVIHDIQGRMIYSETLSLNSNVIELHTANYTEGIYIVHVSTGKTVILDAKLQIKKQD